MATITDVRKIERVPLTHVDDVEAELRGEVLNDARKNFGYAADAFNCVGPLAKVLCDLGITPLDADQVEEYKAYREKVVVRDVGWWVGMVTFALLLLPMVKTVKAFMLSVGSHAWEGPEYFFGVLFVLAGCVTCGVIAAGVGQTANFFWPETRYEWSWERFRLAKKGSDIYTRYVPIHVLNLANQIKKALPEADFVVYALSLKRAEVVRPVADPFLCVDLGAEKYYIAVWDEREFEEKM